LLGELLRRVLARQPLREQRPGAGFGIGGCLRRFGFAGSRHDHRHLAPRRRFRIVTRQFRESAVARFFEDFGELARHGGAAPGATPSATRPAPGSLTVGVPASVTRATSDPACSSSRILRGALSGEWAWKLRRSAGEPTWWSSVLVRRVSSAATTAARFSVSAARGERSPRLPSGVATT